MLEFTFLQDNICRRFTEFVAKQRIPFSIDDDDETITVSISDDENEEVIDRVEAEYDRLQNLSREQPGEDEGESGNNHRKASLAITLGNGEKSYARVDTELVDRILREISTEELNRFVESIVDAVENPDGRSYNEIRKSVDRITS